MLYLVLTYDVVLSHDEAIKQRPSFFITIEFRCSSSGWPFFYTCDLSYIIRIGIMC